MTLIITIWWHKGNRIPNADDFFKLQEWEKILFDLEDFLISSQNKIKEMSKNIKKIEIDPLFKEKIVWLKSYIQNYTTQNKIDKAFIINEVETISKNIKSQDISLILKNLNNDIKNSFDEIIYIWSMPFKKIYILMYIYASMAFSQLNLWNTQAINNNKNTSHAHIKVQAWEKIKENFNWTNKEAVKKPETILKPNKWSKIIVWKKKINLNKRETEDYIWYCARISRQILEAMWIVPPRAIREETFNKNHKSADAIANYESLCLWKNPELLKKYKENNSWLWITSSNIDTNDENDVKKKFNLKKMTYQFFLKWNVVKSNGLWDIYQSSTWKEYKLYSYDDIYRELLENEQINNNKNNVFLMRTLQNNLEITDWHEMQIHKMQNLINWTFEYYVIDPLLNHNFGFKSWKSDDPSMIPLKDYVNFCNSKWRYFLWIMSMWWNKVYNSDQIYDIKKYNENIKNISEENMDNFESDYNLWLKKFTELLSKKWIEKDSITKDINLQDTKAHIFTESSLKSNNHRKNWAWWYWQIEPAAYIDTYNYINWIEDLSKKEIKDMIKDEKSEGERFDLSWEEQMFYYFVYNNIILKQYSKIYTERTWVDFENIDENTKTYIQQWFYNRWIWDFSKILKWVNQEYDWVINWENIIWYLKQKTTKELQEIWLEFHKYKKVEEYIWYIEKIETYKILIKNPNIWMQADSVLLAAE